MSQYAAFDSDKAQRSSVTVFVKPGETPRVTFSGYYDPLTVERQFGRGTDKIITVDGATWEGPPDDSDRRLKGWKIPVKPGWNDVTVRISVLSNKQRVGELKQSFRIYAYVFEVQPAGQLEHPLPGETGNFFLEHPLVDATGNLYVGARRGGGTALLRYDPSGRLSVRYDIKSSMALGGPMGVDDDGNLYAFIAENIVQFDREGKFVKSVAALGSTAGTATAEDLKTGTWPSRRGEDRRDAVLRQISPCASNWETAMIGDAIYFIAHTPENRACSNGPHVLACVTVDGRAQVLDKVTPASGVVRGPDGNIYMREPGKDENNAMLTYSPTGRLEQRRPMIGSRYHPFLGIDGAGFFYGRGHAWEPTLTNVKESAAVDDGRYRRISPYRGQGYYVDLLTGQQSTSNSSHRDLASWMYRGAIHTVYEADLRIARAVSLAPGASEVAPPATLKRGKTKTAVGSGGRTPTPQGGIPGGQTAIPVQNQQPFSPPSIGGTRLNSSGISGISGSDVFTKTPDDEVSPATTALGTLAVGGLTALGAGLMMLGTGVTPRDVIDGVQEWIGGSPGPPPAKASPPVIEDDFERWKRNYESRGWRYAEKDGVAEFEPVEGATNESGWTYSEERGGFVPPEDQRPQPETPPADASYKEEVRLLQEDLERQRDFLDRERERLRQYEQSGLDDLLPGTRERIRQYEKLSDLNQRELERLNEDRPIHTVEDNRDLEADTGERLRSRDLIREINEGDQRIKAGEAILDDSQKEVNRLEEEIQSIEQTLMVTPELSELEKKFLENQEQLLKDGYRVLNPGYDAPWLVAREAIDAAALVIDKTGLGEWIVPGFKAIRCVDFAEIGQKNIEGFVQDLYGPKADEVIVDQVSLDVVRDDSASGQIKQVLDFVAPKNHIANRVILPNGQRYILDYWEGNRGRNIRMVTEEQWLERWKGRLGEDVRYVGSNDDYVRGAQNNLMNQVEHFQKNQEKSTEEAIKVFRKIEQGIIGNSKDSPKVKERHLKQIETLIKSYRRNGQFNSEGMNGYVQ
jgi:hypothetical protein